MDDQNENNNDIQKIDVTNEEVHLNDETQRIDVAEKLDNNQEETDFDKTKTVDIPNQNNNIEELFNEKKPSNKKNMAGFIVVIIIVVVLGIIAAVILFNSSLNSMNKANNTEIASNTTSVPAVEKKAVAKSEYYLDNNNFSKFDMSFLKFENEKVNKIYSPLSIKYAFKMLYEGTTGDAHDQLASIVEGYNLTKYKSNENMAFANAFFIRNSFKDKILSNYSNILKQKYDADVIYDDFVSADGINGWVNNNTLGLINEVISDEELNNPENPLNFALVNALGIDMKWKHIFTKRQYDDDENITSEVYYNHSSFYGWINYEDELYKMKFDDNKIISSMQVIATLNNYDIIKELGEDTIRETVYADFREWALGTGKSKMGKYDSGEDNPLFAGDYSEEGIKKAFDAWFNESRYVTIDTYRNPGLVNEYNGIGYIESIKQNYGKVDYTTDFEIYDAPDVKAFAKDLDEYSGTTLQYVGIMPKNQDLNTFIENTSSTRIVNIINSLKSLKLENFDDGYLTYIHGKIPKFKFEYDLNLKEDMEKLGVTDIFVQGKANLKELTTDESQYIETAKHKANIEFTEEGIKAAATTVLGGGGGGGEGYDYKFDIPIKEIDITFDKPYMFVIRDKKTGEVWFTGTVYEPWDINDEPGTIANSYEKLD